jgi:hypothetical protein
VDERTGEKSAVEVVGVAEDEGAIWHVDVVGESFIDDE